MGAWILGKASARFGERKTELMVLTRQYDALILYSPVGSFLPHHVLLPLCSCHQILHTVCMEASIRVQRILHDYFLLLSFGGATQYTPNQLTLWQILWYVCKNFQSTCCFNGRECTQSSQSQKTSKSKVSERCIAATLLTQHKPFTRDVDLTPGRPVPLVLPHC